MKKRRKVIEDQFEKLREKVTRGIIHLGIDLDEDGVMERLMTIDECQIEAEEWEIAKWAERMLAIAFSLSVSDFHDDASDDELIEALCTANWTIGIFDGLPTGNFQPHICLDCLIKHHSSAIGKIGAAKRHADAPIRPIKRLVHECWQDWQQNLGRYESQEKFASDMVDKWPDELKDSRNTIQKKWIPEWRKQLNK